MDFFPLIRLPLHRVFFFAGAAIVASVSPCVPRSACNHNRCIPPLIAEYKQLQLSRIIAEDAGNELGLRLQDAAETTFLAKVEWIREQRDLTLLWMYLMTMTVMGGLSLSSIGGCYWWRQTNGG